MTEQQLVVTQILLRLSEKPELARECVQFILGSSSSNTVPFTKQEMRGFWIAQCDCESVSDPEPANAAFDEAWDFLIENKAISVRSVN